MKTKMRESGTDIILYQFSMVQAFGRIGDMDAARQSLETAKRIWEELAPVDVKVRSKVPCFTKKYNHFIKVIG